jgi:predicted AAA+ superfamily ATPase
LSKTKIIQRDIGPEVKQLFGQYPVVTITGPRQSGKTTLAKLIFPELPYYSLENIATRDRALTDPIGFLSNLTDGVILDEIHRAPDLLSYIQGIVDDYNKPGLFILTGSNQFSMLEHITQSLAGRTAMLKLLPFSFKEVRAISGEMHTNELILRGLYPGIHSRNLNPNKAYRNYYETYIERDLRQIINIKDLDVFRRFVKLCAGRVGQIWNASNLSNDTGVSIHTIQSWISVLQASYIVFLLPPWYGNIKKRLIKSPKLYFHDVGLASYLLDIETEVQLNRDPLRGALFENLIISELMKRRYNQGLDSNLYYYRDRHGNEIDIIAGTRDLLELFEIKSAQTFTKDFLKNLRYMNKLLDRRIKSLTLVYDGKEEGMIENIRLVPFRRL